MKKYRCVGGGPFDGQEVGMVPEANALLLNTPRGHDKRTYLVDGDTLRWQHPGVEMEWVKDQGYMDVKK